MRIPPNILEGKQLAVGQGVTKGQPAKQWQLIASALNGRIGYGDGQQSDNIDGVWVSVTTGASNPFTVTHNLGRVPVGFHLVQKDASVDLYGSTTGWTSSVLTTNATVAGVPVLLFVF